MNAKNETAEAGGAAPPETPAESPACEFSLAEPHTPASANSEPTAFGKLARKIRSRTTDLLAVSIVLIGGLTVGSQLSRWWAAEDADVLADRSPETNLTWGAEGTPVSLQFGDRPYVLERQTVAGNREQVFLRLANKCAGIAKRASRPPGDFPSAERKLLDEICRLTPVREEAGLWQVFRGERPLTVVIGVRYFQRPAAARPVSGSEGKSQRKSVPAGTVRSGVANRRDTKSGREKSSARAPSVAWSQRRVVCWGFAFPSGEESWTLYTFQPVDGSTEQMPGLPTVELPAGARKILSLRDSSGGALVAFEGEGPAEDWIRGFNRSFEGAAWRAEGVWRESPSGWSATFVPNPGDRPDQSTTRTNLRSVPVGARRVDVTFCRHGDGGLCGIISISPGVTQ